MDKQVTVLQRMHEMVVLVVVLRAVQVCRKLVVLGYNLGLFLVVLVVMVRPGIQTLQLVLVAAVALQR